MTSFLSALADARRLVFTQRTVRLLLRALWTGLAGYLGAWALTLDLNPADAAPLRWTAAGLLAAPALVALLRPLRSGRLAWRMDRMLGLREQLVTAWQVSRDERPPDLISGALLTDAAGLLNQVRPRIARRGWFLQRDLEALLLVAVLFGCARFIDRNREAFSLPQVAALDAPALVDSPAFRDVFPSGVPGLTEAPAGSGSGESPGQAGLGEGELDSLDNILTELGEALSEHPETAEAGEALQNGDLSGAAAAIERTADNIDLLPEEARQNLQQALQQAAQQARDAGQEDLAEDLQAAADALRNPNPNDPLSADALDDLADSLRDLGEAFASQGSGEEDGSAPPENEPQVGSAGGVSGSGSGAGGASPPEPISRLEGAGEDFTLEGEDAPSGLLQPGSSPGTPVTTTGGSSIGAPGSTAGAGPITSILTPYSYSWDWRDVVAQYFSPH